MKKIVTKAELARLCCVSPSRVSVWLKKGVISGDAVIGEGATAKIDADLAIRQIKSKLDPSQSLGEGRKRFEAMQAYEASGSGAEADDDSAVPPPNLVGPARDLWAAKIRYAEANAEKLELQNGITRREYLPAGEVAAEWADVIVSTRAKLLAVPARVRDKFTQLTATEVEFIASEIRSALKELSADDH